MQADFPACGATRRTARLLGIRTAVDRCAARPPVSTGKPLTLHAPCVRKPRPSSEDPPSHDPFPVQAPVPSAKPARGLQEFEAKAITGNHTNAMKQLGLGLNLSTKKTRKCEFLEEMERVVPWAALVQIVEPHCPRAKTGRPLFAAGDHAAHPCAEQQSTPEAWHTTEIQLAGDAANEATAMPMQSITEPMTNDWPECRKLRTCVERQQSIYGQAADR